MFKYLRARLIVLPSRVWRTAVVAVLAFSLGWTGVAFGLVVNGVVEACSNDATGVLRLATAAHPCLTSTTNKLLHETPIAWNQLGPQGIQGNPGPQGATGATGPTGPSGAATTYNYRQGGMYPGTSVAIAFCEQGEKVVGGGGLSTAGFPAFHGLTQSFPISGVGAPAFGTTAVGWEVASEDFNDVQAYVICAQ